MSKDRQLARWVSERTNRISGMMFRPSVDRTTNILARLARDPDDMTCRQGMGYWLGDGLDDDPDRLNAARRRAAERSVCLYALHASTGSDPRLLAAAQYPDDRGHVLTFATAMGDAARIDDCVLRYMRMFEQAVRAEDRDLIDDAAVRCVLTLRRHSEAFHYARFAQDLMSLYLGENDTLDQWGMDYETAKGNTR